MGDDKSWMRILGLGWRTRLGLNWVRGELMDYLKKLFVGKPGLLRTILAVYVVAVVVLNLFGLTAWATALSGALVWLGVTPESAGAPFSVEALVAAVLAFAAVIRPAVRWFVGEPGGAGK